MTSPVSPRGIYSPLKAADSFSSVQFSHLERLPRYNLEATSGCGTASLAMIMTSLGYPRQPWEIDAEIRRGNTAAAPQNLIDYARASGLSAELYVNATLEEVGMHLLQGRAVQVMIDSGDASAVADHYVVIIGLDADGVGFRDPQGGEDVWISRAEFTKRWQSHIGDADALMLVYAQEGDTLSPSQIGNAADELAAAMKQAGIIENEVKPILENSDDPFVRELLAREESLANDGVAGSATDLITFVARHPEYPPPASSTGAWPLADGAAGDFRAATKTEFLWHNSTTGEIGVWDMEGSLVSSAAGLGQAPPGWHLAGAGDFTGLGQRDLLWTHPSGRSGIWRMNGNTRDDIQVMLSISSGWTMAGTINGSSPGEVSIVMRNNLSGENALMHTYHGKTVGVTDLPKLGPDWQFSGSADFRRTGNQDILWHNAASGEIFLWEMNGNEVAASRALPAAPPGWEVGGLADINANNNIDIVWRNRSTNALGVWYMDGVRIQSTAELPAPPDGAWRLAGVRLAETPRETRTAALAISESPAEQADLLNYFYAAGTGQTSLPLPEWLFINASSPSMLHQAALMHELNARGIVPNTAEAIIENSSSGLMKELLARGRRLTEESIAPSPASFLKYAARHPEYGWNNADKTASAALDKAAEDYRIIITALRTNISAPDTEIQAGIPEHQRWNDQRYLEANLDCARLTASGGLTPIQNYLSFGATTGRTGGTGWSETAYLSANPDVAQAVAAGSYRNGIEHYLRIGHTQNRAGSDGGAGLRPYAYLYDIRDKHLAQLTEIQNKVTREAAEAAAAGYDVSQKVALINSQIDAARHWCDQLGIENSRKHLDIAAQTYAAMAAGWRFRAAQDASLNARWSDQEYLAANPDVAAWTAAGGGIPVEHFLLYGYAENRPGAPKWNETAYLAANPDVVEWIQSGGGRSGLEHYLLHGHAQNRQNTTGGAALLPFAYLINEPAYRQGMTTNQWSGKDVENGFRLGKRAWLGGDILNRDTGMDEATSLAIIRALEEKAKTPGYSVTAQDLTALYRQTGGSWGSAFSEVAAEYIPGTEAYPASWRVFSHRNPEYRPHISDSNPYYEWNYQDDGSLAYVAAQARFEGWRNEQAYRALMQRLDPNALNGVLIQVDDTSRFVQGTARDDIMVMSGIINNLNANLDGGNDAVIASGQAYLVDSFINMGSGNDFVYQQGITANSTIIGGTGADVIVLEGMVSGARIYGHGGNDSIVINGLGSANLIDAGEDHDAIGIYGTHAATSIVAGSGNDMIMLDGIHKNTAVDLGRGNDIVYVLGEFTGDATVLDSYRSRARWTGKNVRDEDAVIFTDGKSWMMMDKKCFVRSKNGEEIGRITIGGPAGDNGKVELARTAEGKVFYYDKPILDRPPLWVQLAQPISMALGWIGGPIAPLLAGVLGTWASAARGDVFGTFSSFLGGVGGSVGAQAGMLRADANQALSQWSGLGYPEVGLAQYQSMMQQAADATAAARTIGQVTRGIGIAQRVTDGNITAGDILSIISLGVNLSGASGYTQWGLDTATAIADMAQSGKIDPWAIAALINGLVAQIRSDAALARALEESSLFSPDGRPLSPPENDATFGFTNTTDTAILDNALFGTHADVNLNLGSFQTRNGTTRDLNYREVILASGVADYAYLPSGTSFSLNLGATGTAFKPVTNNNNGIRSQLHSDGSVTVHIDGKTYKYRGGDLVSGGNNNPEAVKAAQALLKQAGYYRGDIDGIDGPQTWDAIRRFKAAHNETNLNAIGIATLRRIPSFRYIDGITPSEPPMINQAGINPASKDHPARSMLGVFSHLLNPFTDYSGVNGLGTARSDNFALPGGFAGLSIIRREYQPGRDAGTSVAAGFRIGSIMSISVNNALDVSVGAGLEVNVLRDILRGIAGGAIASGAIPLAAASIALSESLPLDLKLQRGMKVVFGARDDGTYFIRLQSEAGGGVASKAGDATITAARSWQISSIENIPGFYPGQRFNPDGMLGAQINRVAQGHYDAAPDWLKTILPRPGAPNNHNTIIGGTNITFPLPNTSLTTPSSIAYSASFTQKHVDQYFKNLDPGDKILFQAQPGFEILMKNGIQRIPPGLAQPITEVGVIIRQPWEKIPGIDVQHAALALWTNTSQKPSYIIESGTDGRGNALLSVIPYGQWLKERAGEGKLFNVYRISGTANENLERLRIAALLHFNAGAPNSAQTSKIAIHPLFGNCASLVENLLTGSGVLNLRNNEAITPDSPALLDLSLRLRSANPLSGVSFMGNVRNSNDTEVNWKQI